MSETHWCHRCQVRHRPDVAHLISDLVVRLRELRESQGSPSFRAISYRTDGKLSHTAVSLMFGGKFPRWSSVEAVARALRVNQVELGELRELWQDWHDRRERIRQRVRASRQTKIKEGLVIRPGDTIVIAVEDADDSEALRSQLADQFPDNKVKVIIGGSIAVIRANEEVAA